MNEKSLCLYGSCVIQTVWFFLNCSRYVVIVAAAAAAAVACFFPVFASEAFSLPSPIHMEICVYDYYIWLIEVHLACVVYEASTNTTTTTKKKLICSGMFRWIFNEFNFIVCTPKIHAYIRICDKMRYCQRLCHQVWLVAQWEFYKTHIRKR